jgi:hypothetical protein
MGMIAAFILLAAAGPTAVPAAVNVRFVSDEPRAVLAILDARAAHREITEEEWKRLFATEGYVRLQKREHSMHREFEDDAFRKFVMSDDLLAQRETLARRLEEWLKSDPNDAAAKALAYLPKGATIRAKVYPVIKPKQNSFVFEVDSDPAIFMYLGPDVPRAEFEATIAHEMHHIGYGTVCRSNEGDRSPAGEVRKWIGAFGEGFATLVAAGGPDGEPQRKPEVRAEWQKNMKTLDRDFGDVETFFISILDGKLSGDAIDTRAFEFFGYVGPWYTVGWKMAVVIEKTFGRQALIDAMCDPRKLLETYNRAAAIGEKKMGEKLPRWSERLVKAIG